MSNSLNLKIDLEKAQEIPMVDLAFMVLKAANTPYYYRDLMKEVAKIRGMSEEEISDVIAQLYTEINIDGRFACVGTNLWGLKRWYPLEKSEDAVTSGKRPRIINDEDDDLDDDFVEEEEEGYTPEDGEDYDAVDEDAEEDLFADDDEDEEEVEGVEDDSLLDEEDLEEEDEDLAEDELEEEEFSEED